MSYPKLLLTLLAAVVSFHALAQKSGSVLGTPDADIRLVDSISRIADSMYKAAAAADLAMLGDSTTKDSLSQDSTVIDSTATAETITPVRQIQIKGQVRDKSTGEGVPFATVFIPNSPIGTPADLDGNFTLGFTDPPSDTLRVTAMGYAGWSRRIDLKQSEITVTIDLGRAENMLGEVVVHAGEDPALLLLKEIIKKKPVNNPDRFSNYKYEVYNKLEVDIDRLSRKQFESLPLMRPFGFIYDQMDTVSEEKPFLPFYLTETISDYYFQRSPKKTKEFIKASRVRGVSNESITQFLGGMYQNLNAYDNFLPVFDKQFVSPISNAGAFYYRYKIKDTQEAYGHRIILVQFAPKRNGENCFYGDFWVADSIYTLQRISMAVPKDANINWVNKVNLYQEYAPVQDSLWFCIKDKFVADFNVQYGVKLPGFIGRKTTSYAKIIANSPEVTTVVNDPKLRQDVIVADTARDAGDAYWAAARHDSLTKNEQAIYHMIDTLEHLPAFTRTKNVIRFLATGIQEVGAFELGPVWNLYSTNPVEGTRLRLSLGTTPKLLKDVYFNGYVAYGTLDKELKYKASMLWLLQRHPRSYIYASYIHDVDRSNNYYDETANTDNLFANSFRKTYIPWKLAFVNEVRGEYYKEYFSGFSHKLTLLHKQFDPYDPLPAQGIFYDREGHGASFIENTEIGLNLRFAYKERFLEGNYYRVSMGSKYPIVELRLGMGLKNLWDGGYDYKKASLSVSDRTRISPLGSIYYNVFAGKYIGTLPYPLLEVHPGNDFYFYNGRTFNMMNRYEFISDQYAGFMFEHTIGGGVFNYIPYLKKAKLRQFWTAKGLIGSLDAKNSDLNLNKGYQFRTLEGDPYLELGTGIENILQVFRVDFIWRVTPQPLPTERKEKYFGVFGSVKFAF